MKKLLVLSVSLLICLLAATSSLASVTIQIQNADPAGVGFNDPTAVAPVGGNSGTTLGQQRLNAFQFAAGIWGATLNSNVPIIIRASWDSTNSTLTCTANTAVLGSAGTNGIQRNFANAPFMNTWYSSALANALAGTDLNGGTSEINAQFNPNLGTPNCLAGSPWYLGFDNNHGSGVDLVAVLLHEFAHGLGFQTFTSSSSGAQNSGIPSIYDKFLFDNSTGKTWEQMTNAERVASAVNTGHLTWNGPRVVADVPTVLGTPRLRITSPAGIAGNYTVGTAEFGARLSSPGVAANIAPTFPADACTAVSGSVAGKIAFIDRGSCNFTVKVKNAQNAGALAVIIGNISTSPNPTIPPGMIGADGTITIPAVSLALADADAIRAQLGNTISGVVQLDRTVIAGADSANRVLMFAPNPVQSGSSVSHYDSSAFPNQLMEPDNSGDVTHSVIPPQDLTYSLLRDVGWTGISIGGGTSVQLASSSVSVSEGAGTLTVNVTRTGDTSGSSTVNYATSDTAGSNTCNQFTGAASSRCDYLTTAGTLTFAAGETSKTISIPIVDDVYAEGTETFTLTLSNVTGATLGSPAVATISITDNDSVTGTNPIGTASFFVRQHYIDFLNREPDPNGLAFWTNEITSCGSDANCIAVKRVNVSAAFFLSIEFQETGYLVYRIYKVGLGNISGTPVPVRFTEFLRDTQQIGQGVVVGVGNWQAQLEANKQAYALAFVQRSDFQAAYPNTMTAAEFVDKLNMNANGALSASERTAQINVLGSTPADPTKRSQVLRAVAEDPDLSSAEFNRAFVLMQYFGYLRRNPNDAPDADFGGYNFWLAKLNSFNGDFVAAEMVKAFILSGEYLQRFGP